LFDLVSFSDTTFGSSSTNVHVQDQGTNYSDDATDLQKVEIAEDNPDWLSLM